jgi:hypothetical protein
MTGKSHKADAAVAAAAAAAVFQVAERSLFLWNHEYIITLVAQYRQVRVSSQQQQGLGTQQQQQQQGLATHMRGQGFGPHGAARV